MATWMWVAREESGLQKWKQHTSDRQMRRSIDNLKHMSVHGPMYPQLFCWDSGEVTVYFPRDPVPHQYPDLETAKVVLTMKGLIK